MKLLTSALLRAQRLQSHFLLCLIAEKNPYSITLSESSSTLVQGTEIQSTSESAFSLYVCAKGSELDHGDGRDKSHKAGKFLSPNKYPCLPINA